KLGRFIGRRMRRRRHVVDVNLRLCFPQLTADERARLTSAHFAALGRGLFESGLAWFASDRRLAPHGRVEGLEHFHGATRNGRGALLLTGHFTTLEIGARYLCIAGVPFHAMYRPINNAVIDFCMHRWRQRRSGLPALPKDDLKKLVRALRGGASIWYGPDQTLELRGALKVPFFGVPVLTVTATSRLAELGRAAVVPYMPRREGAKYIVQFQPALEPFPTGDDLADTTRVNHAIEAGVLAAREQYFWVHRRFKPFRPGDVDVYDGR
ncbi:MAG TPA: hypothetical protein VHE37_08345, partial [Nevskiaceae bacterium]|nr:hypothetical protein [Nevskiaceae bacterium]